MTDFQYENIPNLNDITSWVFECNRFLFYAKIRLSDPTYTMKFFDDPIAYVEKISSVCKLSNTGRDTPNALLLLNPKEKSQKIPSVHEINIKISKKKINILINTIKLIKLGKWKKLNLEKIEICQKILLDFFNAFKKEVAKITPCS
jgi:hypothetical protein